MLVEKPLAIDEFELRGLWTKYKEFGGRIMVGYNRRFAPAAVAAKRHLAGNGPLLTLSVNNTVLPSTIGCSIHRKVAVTLWVNFATSSISSAFLHLRCPLQ